MTWASRQAIVVTGSGWGGGWAKSMAPSLCTVQQLGTGSQKYSSSVNPSRRGRSALRKCQSSWSASWSVHVITAGFHGLRTVSVREVGDTEVMSQTTSRVLQLLGLLQSRRVWSGAEL